MPAQTAMPVDVSAVDPDAALRRAAAGSRSSALRRAAPAAVLLAVAAAASIVAPGIVEKFGHAIDRAVHADPGWVAAAVAFELASFVGYVALFWHVAGRATPRVGLRASWEVSLAGTVATRLLPTAGAGGAALTFWSLRRAGQDTRTATHTLLTFLVVLYSVFLGAIVLGAAVHDALALVRRPDARLLGALAWWGFDMLVLWATFSAFGGPPAPVVLVLGYFLGQLANTVPIPGAASGGMVGAFLALGMPAEVALPAVLAYRAIAIWTPVPAGAVALAGLRRTVRRWAVEDGAELPAHEQAAPARQPARTTRAPRRAPGLSFPLAVVSGDERAPPALELTRLPVAA